MENLSLDLLLLFGFFLNFFFLCVICKDKRLSFFKVNDKNREVFLWYLFVSTYMVYVPFSFQNQNGRIGNSFIFSNFYVGLHILWHTTK